MTRSAFRGSNVLVHEAAMNWTSSTMRMAWRNLWRNRRRTALALAAIGLSVTLVLAYTSILRAYGQWIVETITGPMLGHVQAHAPLWRKDRLMERTLRDIEATLVDLRSDPDVASATARIYAPALAAREEEGFAVVVMGIDSRAESGEARLLADVVEPLRAHEALIGRQLAELMNVRVGDEVAVIGQGVDGSLANDLFRVKAVVTTSVDLVNRQGILIELSDAQALFAMPDEAHEIVIHARRPEMASALSRRLTGASGFGGAEVLDWQTLAPEMVTLVRITDLAGLLVLLLVFIAAAAGVANTMVMATFERTREFGMLLALGTHPSRLVRLVIAESIALGVVGALAGSLIGIVLVAITHRTGIDYSWLAGGGPSELSFAGLRFSLRFYPALSAVDVARAIAAVCITSLLAATWPALRASRLQPVQALRGT
jgi:ABC-type lipoprotein release transport system permease subunit